jgi:hypothetical protein
MDQNVTVDFLQKQIDELKSQLNSHSNCDYWKAENGRVQSQIISLIDDIYAENQNDSSEIAAALCEIVDYNPTKEINFTATICFSGTVEVPANEDFDLEDILREAYVDINHGDVVIDEQELYSWDEC